MIPVCCNQQLNLGFIDGTLLTFYPQDIITVIKIEINPAMTKCLLQNKNNMRGRQMILHIGLKDRYDFHFTDFDRQFLSELVTNSALEYKRVLPVRYIGYPVIEFTKPI